MCNLYILCYIRMLLSFLCFLYLVAIDNDFCISQQNIFQKRDPTCAFTLLFDKLCETLKCIDFKRVRKACLLGNSKSLPDDLKNKIKESSNCDDLFDILAEYPLYCNWINIRLLEKIAVIHPPADALIKQYKDEVFLRTLKEILIYIPLVIVFEGQHKTVKEKFQRDDSEVKMIDILEHCKKIEQQLSEENEVLLINSISHGCIEICWLLPNKFVEHAISVSSIVNCQPIKDGDQLTIDLQYLFSEMLYFEIGGVVIKEEQLFSSEIKFYLNIQAVTILHLYVEF